MLTYELRLVVRGLFLAVPSAAGDRLRVALVDARAPRASARALAQAHADGAANKDLATSQGEIVRSFANALHPHSCGLQFALEDWRDPQPDLDNLVRFQVPRSPAAQGLHLFDRHRLTLSCPDGVLDPDDADPPASRPLGFDPSFDELPDLEALETGEGQVRPEVLDQGDGCVALLDIDTGEVGSARRSTRNGIVVGWGYIEANRESSEDLPSGTDMPPRNLDLVVSIRVPSDQPVRVTSTSLTSNARQTLDFYPASGEVLELFLKNRELPSILLGLDTDDFSETDPLDPDFEWLYDLIQEPEVRRIPTTRIDGGASGGSGCGGGKGQGGG